MSGASPCDKNLDYEPKGEFPLLSPLQNVLPGLNRLDSGQNLSIASLNKRLRSNKGRDRSLKKICYDSPDKQPKQRHTLENSPPLSPVVGLRNAMCSQVLTTEKKRRTVGVRAKMESKLPFFDPSKQQQLLQSDVKPFKITRTLRPCFKSSSKDTRQMRTNEKLQEADQQANE